MNLIKRRKTFGFSFFSIILLLSIVVAGTTRVESAISQKPKLVILLIADQFPYNYLWQGADKPQTSGFKQLIDNGASFSCCRYTAATNQTASNLAVIVAGAYPWSTGIVGNEWFDRRKQKIVRPYTESGSVDETNSTANPLHGTTVGDELKIVSNGLSRVVSISTLQSDAMLLSGKIKDETFWWDNHSGNFVGLNRLNKIMPAWVKKFNSRWQASHAKDNDNVPADESYFTQFLTTSGANQMLIDFAKEAIESESLGQHDSSDILNVSFPSFETVGKNYGPYNQENYELINRFDQSLADFLQFLDNKIGLTNCFIVFTSAHGAIPAVDGLKSQGVEGGTIDAKFFRNQLNNVLSSKLGKANWIDAFVPPNLYLNLSAIDRSTYKQPDVEKLCAKLGRSIAEVAEIYTAFQFFMNQVPVGPQVAAVEKSYFWGRSGELYVIPKPGFTFLAESDGTACGSPYSYDSQVPLIIFGSMVKPGNYSEAASPADIAPTIASVLGMSLPSLVEGRVLHEALNWTAKTKYVKPGK